jgi:hypothetical protein
LADDVERWTALLDELDRQLIRSSPKFGVGALTGSAGIWPIDEICASIGPVGRIPSSLVTRARALLSEYAEAETRIQNSRRLVGEHIEMLQTARAHAGATPVYLDSVG